MNDYGFRTNLVSKMQMAKIFYIDDRAEKVRITEETEHVLDELTYLPHQNKILVLDNFDKIVDAIDNGGVLTLGSFIKTAKRLGYLKFKPFVIKDNITRVTTLVLECNRFLQLTGGRYFQVSYTANGMNKYSASNIPINKVHMVTNMDLGNKISDFTQMMYYMNAVSAAFEVESFRELLRENPEVFDEFMHRTFIEHGLSSANNGQDGFIKYSQLSKHIIGRGDDVYDKKPDKIYNIPKDKTSDYLRIKVYDSRTLMIESCDLIGERATVAVIPNPLNERCFADYSTEESFDLSDCICNNVMVFEQYVTYVLNYFGFVVTGSCIYPIHRVQTSMRISDNCDTIRVNVISDIKCPRI